MKGLHLLVLATCLISGANLLADDTSTVSKEWRSFIDPLAPLGAQMAELMENSDDPLARHEMYRMLFSGLSMGYMGLFLGDTEHPDFWPLFNQAYDFGAANPDDAYYVAPVDGTGSYKISGFRGSVRIVDFQIGKGTIFTHGNEAGPTLANYNLDDLAINDDGSFEVILSSERPANYSGNWWRLDPESDYIFVRQVAYDWINEVDGRFAIERMDTPAIRPRANLEELQANLHQMSVFTKNWTKFGFLWLKAHPPKGLINKVEVHPIASIGGFSEQAQVYIEGLFDIKADEALIYETEIPETCRYWNITLTDMQFSTIDWTNRQSNLNGHTAKLDSDGKFRAVVAGSDPGVPNWLDTGEHQQGAFFGRWKGCSSTPTPTITKVKLSEVRNYLPENTPVITAQQRDVSLRLRRKGAQLRRRW